MPPSRFRSLVVPVVGILLLSACSASPAVQPGGSLAVPPSSGAGQSAAASTGTSGTGSASLVQAAAEVQDACVLIPMDLVPAIVPDAAQPVTGQFPTRCTISNGTSVIELTIAAFDAVDPPVPNEPVAGLGVAAYLQKQSPDNAYLKVILDPDGGAVYVEVAGHDGKDHGADAIAIAQRVLAGLE